MSDDKWTEDRVLANSEKSFYFERKAGELLNRSELKHKLAKAISAFANSEGGSIALGVKDDGSFDGVDKNHKGNARTSEWLGDVIKTLVVPRVQRVHIQEVHPAVPTLIPVGKILIVIDVEKSEFAPHQSTEDNIYYYRVEKQSNAAPHNYIENLFNREKFPGPNVAGTWINSVINPMLNHLARENTALEREYWGYDMFRKNTLQCTGIIVTADQSPNWEQFFQYNEDILDNLKEHDRLAKTLIR